MVQDNSKIPCAKGDIGLEKGVVSLSYVCRESDVMTPSQRPE